jgi:hypothetical protein
LAVGAIVLLIVIFSAGLVVTNGSAKAEKLKSWGENNRSDCVQKQGWATMLGEKEPDGQVADEAARLLIDLKM